MFIQRIAFKSEACDKLWDNGVLHDLPESCNTFDCEVQAYLVDKVLRANISKLMADETEHLNVSWVVV